MNINMHSRGFLDAGCRNEQMIGPDDDSGPSSSCSCSVDSLATNDSDMICAVKDMNCAVKGDTMPTGWIGWDSDATRGARSEVHMAGSLLIKQAGRIHHQIRNTNNNLDQKGELELNDVSETETEELQFTSASAIAKHKLYSKRKGTNIAASHVNQRNDMLRECSQQLHAPINHSISPVAASTCSGQTDRPDIRTTRNLQQNRYMIYQNPERIVQIPQRYISDSHENSYFIIDHTLYEKDNGKQNLIANKNLHLSLTYRGQATSCEASYRDPVQDDTATASFPAIRHAQSDEIHSEGEDSSTESENQEASMMRYIMLNEYLPCSFTVVGNDDGPDGRYENIAGPNTTMSSPSNTATSLSVTGVAINNTKSIHKCCDTNHVDNMPANHPSLRESRFWKPLLHTALHRKSSHVLTSAPSSPVRQSCPDSEVTTVSSCPASIIVCGNTGGVNDTGDTIHINNNAIQTPKNRTRKQKSRKKVKRDSDGRSQSQFTVNLSAAWSQCSSSSPERRSTYFDEDPRLGVSLFGEDPRIGILGSKVDLLTRGNQEKGDEDPYDKGWPLATSEDNPLAITPRNTPVNIVGAIHACDEDPYDKGWPLATSEDNPLAITPRHSAVGTTSIGDTRVYDEDPYDKGWPMATSQDNPLAITLRRNSAEHNIYEHTRSRSITEVDGHHVTNKEAAQATRLPKCNSKDGNDDNDIDENSKGDIRLRKWETSQTSPPCHRYVKRTYQKKRYKVKRKNTSKINAKEDQLILREEQIPSKATRRCAKKSASSCQTKKSSKAQSKPSDAVNFSRKQSRTSDPATPSRKHKGDTVKFNNCQPAKQYVEPVTNKRSKQPKKKSKYMKTSSAATPCCSLNRVCSALHMYSKSIVSREKEEIDYVSMYEELLRKALQERGQSNSNDRINEIHKRMSHEDAAISTNGNETRSAGFSMHSSDHSFSRPNSSIHHSVDNNITLDSNVMQADHHILDHRRAANLENYEPTHNYVVSSKHKTGDRSSVIHSQESTTIPNRKQKCHKTPPNAYIHFQAGQKDKPLKPRSKGPNAKIKCKNSNRTSSETSVPDLRMDVRANNLVHNKMETANANFTQDSSRQAGYVFIQKYKEGRCEMQSTEYDAPKCEAANLITQDAIIEPATMMDRLTEMYRSTLGENKPAAIPNGTSLNTAQHTDEKHLSISSTTQHVTSPKLLLDADAVRNAPYDKQVNNDMTPSLPGDRLSPPTNDVPVMPPAVTQPTKVALACTPAPPSGNTSTCCQLSSRCGQHTPLLSDSRASFTSNQQIPPTYNHTPFASYHAPFPYTNTSFTYNHAHSQSDQTPSVYSMSNLPFTPRSQTSFLNPHGSPTLQPRLAECEGLLPSTKSDRPTPNGNNRHHEETFSSSPQRRVLSAGCQNLPSLACEGVCAQPTVLTQTQHKIIPPFDHLQRTGDLHAQKNLHSLQSTRRKSNDAHSNKQKAELPGLGDAVDVSGQVPKTTQDVEIMTGSRPKLLEKLWELLQDEDKSVGIENRIMMTEQGTNDIKQRLKDIASTEDMLACIKWAVKNRDTVLNHISSEIDRLDEDMTDDQPLDWPIARGHVKVTLPVQGSTDKGKDKLAFLRDDKTDKHILDWPLSKNVYFKNDNSGLPEYRLSQEKSDAKIRHERSSSSRDNRRIAGGQKGNGSTRDFARRAKSDNGVKKNSNSTKNNDDNNDTNIRSTKPTINQSSPTEIDFRAPIAILAGVDNSTYLDPRRKRSPDRALKYLKHQAKSISPRQKGKTYRKLSYPFKTDPTLFNVATSSLPVVWSEEQRDFLSRKLIDERRREHRKKKKRETKGSNVNMEAWKSVCHGDGNPAQKLAQIRIKARMTTEDSPDAGFGDRNASRSMYEGEGNPGQRRAQMRIKAKLKAKEQQQGDTSQSDSSNSLYTTGPSSDCDWSSGTTETSGDLDATTEMSVGGGGGDRDYPSDGSVAQTLIHLALGGEGDSNPLDSRRSKHRYTRAARRDEQYSKSSNNSKLADIDSGVSLLRFHGDEQADQRHGEPGSKQQIQQLNQQQYPRKQHQQHQTQREQHQDQQRTPRRQQQRIHQQDIDCNNLPNRDDALIQVQIDYRSDSNLDLLDQEVSTTVRQFTDYVFRGESLSKTRKDTQPRRNQLHPRSNGNIPPELELRGGLSNLSDTYAGGDQLDKKENVVKCDVMRKMEDLPVPPNSDTGSSDFAQSCDVEPNVKLDCPAKSSLPTFRKVESDSTAQMLPKGMAKSSSITSSHKASLDIGLLMLRDELSPTSQTQCEQSKPRNNPDEAGVSSKDLLHFSYQRDNFISDLSTNKNSNHTNPTSRDVAESKLPKPGKLQDITHSTHADTYYNMLIDVDAPCTDNIFQISYSNRDHSHLLPISRGVIASSIHHNWAGAASTL